ncbi:MAG: alanine racemase [Mogibacterium sp.]|nr:alanine racemase [Mogibacterium sp.]
MQVNRYPAVIIDHRKYRENARTVYRWCHEKGLLVAGIIKGTSGITGIAADLVWAGADMIGSSRLDQIRHAQAEGVQSTWLLIRIPMLSEVPDVVATADISLNSELAVLAALNREALRQSRVHRVILMADLGDLREGWIDQEELIQAAVQVETAMDGLRLEGIGTNLGCYGSVMPTKDKLESLAALAERVEEAIGRPLDIVSGGATSSLMAVFDGYLPARINMLRIGAAPMTGPLEDLRTSYGRREMDALHDDAFVLEAEIIELKTKPSYPIGELGVDATGHSPTFIDRGMRRRAIVAVGRADYGDPYDIIPELAGAEVIGASGDHTLIDVTDVEAPLHIGDVLRFRLRYSAILNLTANEDIAVREISALD